MYLWLTESLKEYDTIPVVVIYFLIPPSEHYKYGILPTFGRGGKQQQKITARCIPLLRFLWSQSLLSAKHITMCFKYISAIHFLWI